LAVPSIILTAFSRVLAFKSFNLIFAISSACFLESSPTFSLLGSAEPFSRFKAFFISTAAGGVLVIKVKLLSL